MKILIAVDGSECSDVAVEEVAKRPWPAEPPLLVCGLAHRESKYALHSSIPLSYKKPGKAQNFCNLREFQGFLRSFRTSYARFGLTSDTRSSILGSHVNPREKFR
jgi:hypothetical protein